MKYEGDFCVKLNKGKVKFPWKNCCGEEKMWIISQWESDGKILKEYAVIDSAFSEKYENENRENLDNFCIAEKGEFICDEKNMWDVPGVIQKYLNNGDMWLCGIEDYIKIRSEKEMKEFKEFCRIIEEKIKSIVKKNKNTYYYFKKRDE